MQHVVEAAVDARALERRHVEGLFHDADLAVVTRRVGAEGARVPFRHVETDRAEHDALLDLDDGLGQAARLFLGQAQHKIGQALSGLRPNAW